MSFIYPKFAEQLMQHGADTQLSTETIIAVMVDTNAYTYSASHQYRSSLTGVMKSTGSTDATRTINNQTFTNGVFDTSDTFDTFGTVDANYTVYEALVLIVDTGSAATSPLFALIDGFTPVRPNGGEIIFDWDDVTSVNGTTGGIVALGG